MLVPDGLLLRWPFEKAWPEVGEDFEGQTVRLEKPEHLPLLRR
ncbi:MAG TPA: hypothetical protein VLS89_06725 [Candidatus Nanopelagicales bacterium]|nr:hypothetical protein [Candidatus Nanopelagicales bacterium]